MVILYHPEYDRINLWIVGEQSEVWEGNPYSPWRSLELALSFGWEVVGEV